MDPRVLKSQVEGLKLAVLFTLITLMLRMCK